MIFWLDFTGLSIVDISFRGAAIAVVLMSSLVLYRAIIGPKRSDRVLSINVLTTNVIVILVIIAYMTGDYTFIDAATVYVLCAFIGTLSVLKYLVWRRIN